MATDRPISFRLKLKTVLNNGFAFIRPLAEEAGISLAIHSELENTEILGDANGLQQVILNLALNAFRHTPMGGSLTISAPAQGRACGCGLLGYG